jgi:hypothetical protein
MLARPIPPQGELLQLFVLTLQKQRNHLFERKNVNFAQSAQCSMSESIDGECILHRRRKILSEFSTNTSMPVRFIMLLHALEVESETI